MNRIIAFFMSIFTTIFTLGGLLGGSDVNVRVDPSETKQTVTGFGTSACWWSQMIDSDATRADIIQKLYGPDGLRLNIYRYNIGGGVNPAHERITDPWHRTESFYVFNDATGQWEFDFTRDANAQKALFAALSFGTVDTVVLFANSPHYSMTISGEASGSTKSGVSNLAKEHYQDFVDYFLTITEYFLSKGVPVKYISPINEPQWGWGGNVHQEGCHYELDEIVALLHLFAEGIESRGLPVKLSVPDSGEIGDTTRKYFSAIAADDVILRNTASFAYHSYWSDTDAAGKERLGTWFRSQSFANQSLDMTEWCELPNKHAVNDPVAAALMARVIANDMQLTGVNSWTSWVAVNAKGVDRWNRDYSDGLFSAAKDFSSYAETYRYYALGHFSKFVPVGSTAIGGAVTAAQRIRKNVAKNINLAAFKTPQNAVVLVLSNEGNRAKIQLNAVGSSMEIYTTDSDHRLAQTYQGGVQSGLTLPKNSVTTIVIHP